MSTDEKALRIACRERDESVYEDSCMEFFFKPFSSRDEYINIEINPVGAYLSQFGASRDDRRFVKDLTTLHPDVSSKITDGGWQTELFIPCEMINELFGERFTAGAEIYYGNFYKCGDKTQAPHYGSFSPMGGLPPGFHDPALFAKIKISDFRSQI